ncbi:MAG: hypothetical protein GEU75_09860 [Dehalococcoidia bacterium]|nr:hypothetical protein [Dehalococcoidia bacterium]
MSRGRPKHDDILTPREWQVLELIREGLKNDEIGARLGISENGVKYHVSEILSKLGVRNRVEAAAWQREPVGPSRRRWSAWGLFAWPLRAPLANLAGGALVVGSVVIIAAMALGVFVSNERREAALAPGALGKLAYIQNGDLWLMALPDGTPLQITTGGQASSPLWSADGDWLAFSEGEAPNAEYWLMRSDGSGKRRLDDRVIWSPKGNRAAYIAANGDIVVETADGSAKQTAATTSLRPVNAPTDWRGASFSDLAWSPDGDTLAFGVTQLVRRPTDPTPVACPTPVPPTPRPTLPPQDPPRLFEPPESPPPMPTACPGSQPSVQRPSFYSGIWIVDLKDGTPRVVQDNGIFDSSPSARYVVDRWTADGREILFRLTLGASALAGGLPLHAVTVNGGQSRVMDDASIYRPEFIDLSPDGTKLAIAEGTIRYTWTRKRIAVADLSSGSLTYLTDEQTAALSPVWSPDGKQIAHLAGPDIGDVPGGNPAKDGMAQRRIWIMEADGSGNRPLTTAEAYREEAPRWSPDGSTILFVRLDSEDQASLWMVPADGGGPAVRIVSLSRPRTPLEAEIWFGFYGRVDWASYLDIWTGS